MPFRSRITMKSFGLFFGPVIFAAGLFFQPDGLSPEAWKVICMAGLMLVWWVSEAVPLPVTALLPVLLLPLLGVMSIGEATAPYASDIVFLFLGGFILALAIEKWNLHRRIALNIVCLTGTGSNRIVLGFMLATAVLSMWISNTAAAVMMLPIATSVVSLLVRDDEGNEEGVRKFALVLMLGIAYSANIGGTATLIGTPPNIVMAGILENNHGINVGFLDWMKVGLPFAVVMLFVSYWLLTKVLYPIKWIGFGDALQVIQKELLALGKMSTQEKRVLAVFGLTAFLWIFRKLINENITLFELTDSGIAIFAGIILFVVFAGNEEKGALLKWRDTRNLPWGILLLFGGGLSLANALNEVGLIQMIGDAFAYVDTVQTVWIVLSLAAVSLLMTEFMSNVALTSVLIPVVAAIAIGMGEDVLAFAVPVTLAASCAFMMPMSTPPNAIVFASNRVTVAQMFRAGILHNVAAIVLIWLFCTYVLPVFL